MSVALTVNGVAYTFPNTGDSLWGDNVTNWATAVTNGLIQKAGGNFTLTGQLNFGLSYGLTAGSFISGGVPTYNVKAYGALGDGSTNDQAAIASAIAAATNGGVIYFPPGTYKVSTSLNVNIANLVFFGDGVASKISFAAGACFNVSVNNTSFRRLWIAGSGSGSLGTTTTDCGIYATGTVGTYLDGLSVQDCKISDTLYYGVYLNFIKNVRIQGNHILNVAYAGISIWSGNNGCVTGNLIQNVAVTSGSANSYGITITRGSGSSATFPVSNWWTVSGNTVQSVPNWYGIDTHCGNDISIAGNEVYNALGGIGVTAGNESYAPKRVAVTGNSLYCDGNNTSPGIGITIYGRTTAPGTNVVIDYADSVSVVGNVINGFGNDADLNGGIIAQAATNLVISNNQITLPQRFGIVLYGDILGFHIVGNEVTDPFGSGGTSGFLEISGDYIKGHIGANTLYHGSKSATTVAARHVHCSGTFTNSKITVDITQYSDFQDVLYNSLTSASDVVYTGSSFTFKKQLIGLGTATNDSAATGYIGEYLESLVTSLTNAPTSGQYGDLTSKSLTAGDWLVTGVVDLEGNGATVTSCTVGLSTTTGNSSAGMTLGVNLLDHAYFPTSGGRAGYVMPTYRFSLSTTTTVYLKQQLAYSVATPQFRCRLSCWRVR